MIKFFVRLGLALIAIFCTEIIAFAFDVSPFVIVCIFICSWITIISFKNIFWWIFMLSIIFGLLYYDVFGLFTLGILLVAFVFNLIYVQVVRSANNIPIVLYGIAVLLITVIINILEIIIQHHLFFDLYTLVINIIVTLISFFFFRFSIGRAEYFINLYAHGTDMRCHT